MPYGRHTAPDCLSRLLSRLLPRFPAGLEERLRGVRCRSDALAGALNGVAWQEYFSHCDPQRMEQFFTTL